MKKIEIFGVPIHAITLLEARKAFPTAKTIFTPNPEILLEARKSSDFHNALNEADLLLPDGHGLLLVSTLRQFSSKAVRALLWLPLAFLFVFWKKPFKKVIPEIIHGSDFMRDIIQWADESKKTVAFLGGAFGRAEKTAKVFSQIYPGLKVVGASSLHPSEEAFEWVKTLQPDLLFIAYGAPKEQMWLKKYRSQLPRVGLVMGVGGSFDFYSGAIPRAPKILRRLGLEWLWRLLREPKKRFKRIFRATILFPWVALFSSEIDPSPSE